MVGNQDGRLKKSTEARKRFSSPGIVRFGPAKEIRVAYEDLDKHSAPAPASSTAEAHVSRQGSGHARLHRLEHTFNQLTENNLQRQLQQYRMVQCINRPRSLRASALMELCEGIDQSRRMAMDSSNLGADLLRAIAVTAPSPEWRALSFQHLTPVKATGILCRMRAASVRDTVTFSWGPLAGTTWTFQQLRANRQSEQLFGGVLWYNVFMKEYYGKMRSGALSAEETRQFPGNLVQQMLEYTGGLYLLGFEDLDTAYKTAQPPLDLSEAQMGRLREMLRRQQRQAQGFQISIGCMEDVLKESHAACCAREGANFWDPQDLHVQNAYAALKEGRQKQRISEIKLSSEIMFNILTPYQLALLKCDMEFNVVRQSVHDWADWMRLFHILLPHCG